MNDEDRVTSVFIISVTITFMVCGANSDLFSRRYFIVPGHILVFVGAIVGGTSYSMTQTIVAHVLLGSDFGNCQLSAFAISELLPNKCRHIGVIIVDTVAFFAFIAGPVTSRVAINHGNDWRWGYWSVAIAIFLSFGVMVTFYFPPKHPRGIPWNQALKNLDWYKTRLSSTISNAG
jgi:MFS family permease